MPITVVPTTREKLWSQEVKESDPYPEKTIAYSFSGRIFYNETYRKTPLLSEPINE